MSDQIAQIKRMNKSELLDYVVANPHYLTDPYYKMLRDAIKQRCQDLTSTAAYSRRSRYG